MKNVYSEHGVVIVENFDRHLEFFTSERIVGARATVELDIHLNTLDYAIVKSEVDQNLFYSEIIVNKTSLAVNLYKMTFEKTPQSIEKNAQKFQDVMECVANLKSLMKNRFPMVQSSQQKVDRDFLMVKQIF